MDSMTVVNLDDDDFYIKQETESVTESSDKGTILKRYLLDHNNHIECSQCIETFDTKDRDNKYHDKRLQ